jgi:3',5'-cyclic AMP phosphodiesterase CpdA
MRLLHISDVHVPVPLSAIPPRDWLSKRLIGGLNYLVRRGPRFADAETKLAQLAELCEAQHVDLVICTGDFTVLGTEPEHEAARRAIAPLARRPAGFLAVPGNHDVYLKDSVEADRFTRHFGDLIAAHGSARALTSLATDGPYPRVWKLSDEVSVLAVESARPNPQPWRSSGRIPEAQLTGLRAALGHADLLGTFKVVITHYAPRLWDGRPDRRTHGLENADALLDVMRPHERTCLLHGHIHKRYAVTLPGFKPTVLCAGSATERGHEGGWLIDVDARSARATEVGYAAGRYRPMDRTVTLG